MSAVSKKLMPTSSAASTTLLVASASRRGPKLLQPRPITETCRDPIRRVSIALPSPAAIISSAASARKEPDGLQAREGAPLAGQPEIGGPALSLAGPGEARLGPGGPAQGRCPQSWSARGIPLAGRGGECAAVFEEKCGAEADLSCPLRDLQADAPEDRPASFEVERAGTLREEQGEARLPPAR